MWSILNGWVFKHIVRIRLLIAALQAGTVRTRKSPQPGTRDRADAVADAVAAPAWVLPRDRGWLLTMVRAVGLSLPHGSLAILLEDPEMVALLASSPRLVRTMKPLCRALGVEMPKFPPPPVPPVAGPQDEADMAPRPDSPVVRPSGGRRARRGVAAAAVARYAAGDPRFRK
jgi:hypothetical protein